MHTVQIAFLVVKTKTSYEGKEEGYHLGPCLFLLGMCCVGMLWKKTVDQMHWYHWGLCALLVKMLVLLDLSYSHTAIESLYIFAFLCLLACIALIDHYWLIIPDSGVVLFWFMAFPLSTVSLQERLFSVSIILLITLCLRKWKGNCIGWGDVKLCSVAAWSFGFAFLSALQYSVFCSGIYAFIAWKLHRVGLQTRLPFGPWITLGVLFLFL